VNRNSV